MTQEPFVYMHSDTERCELSVPPGHEGYVLSAAGRNRLGIGVHRLNGDSASAVFVVPVGASHSLDLISLGGALLYGTDGGWQPLKVMGRLSYSVAKPDLLVDLLEREQIYEPEKFERELSRIVAEQLAMVVEGEAWSASKLDESLEFASGEVLRNLIEVVAPLGLDLQAFELVTGRAASDAPLQAPA